MNAGTRWAMAIGGLLTIPVVANFGLMALAKSDASFAVEGDYYRRAVAWDATRAAEARGLALGWSVSLATTADGRLRATVTDRDGLPLDDASVSVEAFHNARAGEKHQATLRTDHANAGDHTYVGALPMTRSGVWVLRVTVDRAGERFETTVRRDVVGGRAL